MDFKIVMWQKVNLDVYIFNRTSLCITSIKWPVQKVSSNLVLY